VPVVVRPKNVGELFVAIDCGRLSVTVPVAELAITWLAVPVIDCTPKLVNVTEPVELLTFKYVLPVRLVTPKLLIVTAAAGPVVVWLVMPIPVPAVCVTLVITLLPVSVIAPVLVTVPNVTVAVELMFCGKLNVTVPVAALAVI